MSHLSANGSIPQQHYQHGQQMQQHLDGAGRAVWGCICEARKVLDACAAEYSKTTSKLQKLEEAVEEIKAKVDEETEETLVDSGAEVVKALHETTTNVRQLIYRQGVFVRASRLAPRLLERSTERLATSFGGPFRSK